jgi:hypothetical protein
VPVDGRDWDRLGDDAERWTVWLGNRAFMRMEEGHCAALVRERSGRWACSVYVHRPEVCRALERGSAACEAELVRKLPVLR